MSFTVNRRRKEIGIRAALDARPWRLVAGIFGRAMGRIGLGALGGVAVALLALLGPARRNLRVDPVQELR